MRRASSILASSSWIRTAPSLSSPPGTLAPTLSPSDLPLPLCFARLRELVAAASPLTPPGHRSSPRRAQGHRLRRLRWLRPRIRAVHHRIVAIATVPYLRPPTFAASTGRLSALQGCHRAFLCSLGEQPPLLPLSLSYRASLAFPPRGRSSAIRHCHPGTRIQAPPLEPEAQTRPWVPQEVSEPDREPRRAPRRRYPPCPKPPPPHADVAVDSGHPRVNFGHHRTRHIAPDP
jgi:hypothetical protein